MPLLQRRGTLNVACELLAPGILQRNQCLPGLYSFGYLQVHDPASVGLQKCSLMFGCPDRCTVKSSVGEIVVGCRALCRRLWGYLLRCRLLDWYGVLCLDGRNAFRCHSRKCKAAKYWLIVLLHIQEVVLGVLFSLKVLVALSFLFVKQKKTCFQSPRRESRSFL